MKRFNNWYHSLSMEQITWLAVIFITTIVGTLASSTVLKLGMSAFENAGVWAQLMVSLAATAVYAIIVVVVISIFFPKEMRLALKRLPTNKK
ncbi:MAG: hypothetical protein KC441_08385 [Anaerolineales bacterium]|nr:hypothetical protein [Anaerolineales bacterium]